MMATMNDMRTVDERNLYDALEKAIVDFPRVDLKDPAALESVKTVLESLLSGINDHINVRRLVTGATNPTE